MKETIEINNSIPLTEEEANSLKDLIIKSFSEDDGLSTTYIVLKENKEVFEDLLLSFL